MKLLMTLLTTFGLMLSPLVLADRGHGHHYKHRHHHYHHAPRVVYERPVVYERTVVYEQPVAYARVISAEPIYEEVAIDRPYQSCGIETTRYRATSQDKAVKGAIVGGIIGAAIGHEVGGRHDAFWGGLAGASIGQGIAHAGGNTYYEDREVCRSQYRTEYRRELVGYDVGYRYNGRVYYTRSSHHPGSSIQVNINLL